MKEPVTDMSQVMEELADELPSMRETIDAQYTEIASLNRNVQRLQKENHELRKHLEKHGKPDKDSGNSSTPPSWEKMKDVIRQTKTLRKKSVFRLCGDIDFENVASLCSHIIPVPGGVGPMTKCCHSKNHY